MDSGDRPAAELSIFDASGGEGAVGSLQFPVRLDPASSVTVTVGYASADSTASEGEDYTRVSGTLTFVAGATAQTVAVPVIDDDAAEGGESFIVTLFDPRNAILASATATGYIADDDGGDSQEGDNQDTSPQSDSPAPPRNRPAPKLSKLEVSGGGAMYPVFADDIYHYALRCGSSATLVVEAETARSGADLNLLRKNDDHLTVSDALKAEVDVSDSTDVVIQLTDSGQSETYIVHCIPFDFPDLKPLKKTAAASDGLLFVSGALIDYNGVPRLVLDGHGENFRPIPDGPIVDGKAVRYATHGRVLDRDFALIREAEVIAPLQHTDFHDFLVTRNGFLFISNLFMTYDDFSHFSAADQSRLPPTVTVADAVIQEVSFAESELFRWTSWQDLAPDPDCRFVEGYLNNLTAYTDLNSLQVVDGDIIASFRDCSLVLRIDRSGDTGSVVWKLGGTNPNTGVTHLPVVGDSLGEFCAQHHVTLTDSETVVLFDNGVQCLGPRKNNMDIVSRVVEYDISSGTQANFVREYRRPDGQGFSEEQGSVTVIDGGPGTADDRWLIAWGTTDDATASVEETISVSEVNPATGTSLFELNMTDSGGLVVTYRIYHAREADVSIPLTLPTVAEIVAMN